MKYLLSGASLVAMVIGAQAADLTVKAPSYKTPVATAYDWTGFYTGVNVGVGVGRDLTNHSSPLGNLAENEQFHLSPWGAIGGGQIGYNWQSGYWLFGVEADIEASGHRDNSTCLRACPGAGIGGVLRVNYDQKLDWFGTVRGRVGYTSGSLLTYVTGGYAYGRVGSSLTDRLDPVGTATSSADTIRSGYALGSGLEAALGGNWTGKIEYLYLNLGSIGSNYSFPFVPNVGVINGTTTSDIRDHIFRVGLNYRINGNSAAAKMEVADWSGAYVGINAGLGVARSDDATGIILNLAGLVAPLEQFTTAPAGILGGGQLGYNYQLKNWVVGVEADVQASSLKDSSTCVSFCSTSTAPNAVTQSITVDQRINYLATMRGRVGYSTGPALFYATAGYAFGEITDRIVVAAGPPANTFEFRNRKGGWTAGGGIESSFQLLGPNWTAKTEYLYVDLGRNVDTLNTIGFPTTFTTHTQVHIFRSGLNYHFNQPVVAKY